MQPLNLKDLNISKSTIFKMINYKTFNIKFKKKILKEEFFEFVKKNLENKINCEALDSKVFQFHILRGNFRYQWGNNYNYAEEISNLVNKKFSSLESLTDDEIFEFKSLLSENLKDNGKITIGNKIILWIASPIIVFFLWTFIYTTFISDKRFLEDIDYEFCRAEADPFKQLRTSKDPGDVSNYFWRYDNCIEKRIERKKPQSR